VLGITSEYGEITIVEGWNWYVGADAAWVEQNQFDFQTVVTHELGHALGLGHSASTDSVMYPALATGVTRRGLATVDLSSSESQDGPEALLAAPFYRKEVGGYTDATVAQDDKDNGGTAVYIPALAQTESEVEAGYTAASSGDGAALIVIRGRASGLPVADVASREGRNTVVENSQTVAAYQQSPMTADNYTIVDMNSVPSSFLTGVHNRADIEIQVKQPAWSSNANSFDSTLPHETLIKDVVDIISEAERDDDRVATLSPAVCDSVFAEEAPIYNWGTAAMTFGTVVSLVGRELPKSAESDHRHLRARNRFDRHRNSRLRR
jgi:hypothetical protein